MVKITALFVLSAVTCFASAAPFLEKRISQITIDSVKPWEDACKKAGGTVDQCSNVSVTAAATLLAAAGACEQQNSADQMIDLAKQFGSDPEMIRLAQIFVQQPRNAPDSLQVPYCQQAPANAELNGLFHCQFASSKFPNFSGSGGTVPLGLSAVSPPGSCPANPAGPVPDGVQLNTIVQNPGAGGAVGTTGNNNGGDGGAAGNGAPVATAPATQAAPPAASPTAASQPQQPAPAALADGAKPFTHQNGVDAKALNAKFASLTASSACTAGENACVGDAFAQCVGGKFVLTNCAGGTVCAALPLVNSPGTSITCTTPADRDARIAATGA